MSASGSDSGPGTVRAPVRPSASTRVLALLGDPVSHSLSPEIQNAAFGEAGVDGVYVALRCGREDLEGFMRGIGRAGGGGNVTLPHKERAAAAVDVPSEAVRRTGACNTFWGTEEGIHGDNTDVEGFSRALGDFLGGPPRDHRVLLLGAGGAARAVLLALLDDEVGEVSVLNRTTERARAVTRRIGGSRARVVDRPDDLDGARFDLVVHATPLGLAPDDPLPLDLDRFDRIGAVVDLVYGPEGTPLVREARKRSIRATDGGGMLVHQAAVAFERWWERPAPLEVMKEALSEARAGGA